MSENFKFENIDISCKGPFLEGQNLKFLNKVNIISADNGLGKTTIFNSLIDHFDRKYAFEIHDKNIIKKLIFINHASITLNHLIFILQSNKVDISRVEILISEFLMRIMREKFAVGYNKFSRYRAKLKYISVKIEDTGTVKIFSDSFEDISHNFEAAEEQMALLFSFVFTARKILNFDFPLVCDDLFSYPSDVINGIIAELIRGNSQIILLGHPELWGGLQIKPTVVLELDSDKRHSIIHYH